MAHYIRPVMVPSVQHERKPIQGRKTTEGKREREKEEEYIQSYRRGERERVMHGFRVVSDDGEGDDDASRVEVEQAGDEVCSSPSSSPRHSFFP